MCTSLMPSATVCFILRNIAREARSKVRATTSVRAVTRLETTRYAPPPPPPPPPPRASSSSPSQYPGPFLHRASSAAMAQLTRGFPSFAFTSLCRSHTQRDNASRLSTRGGFRSISSRKSTRQVEHGYKSPSASKNRRACTLCVADGTSCDANANVSLRALYGVLVYASSSTRRDVRGNTPPKYETVCDARANANVSLHDARERTHS